MEQQQQANFSGWALVELMGHQKEVGYVTTQYFGGTAMLQIDMPELPEREETLLRPTYESYTTESGDTKYNMLPAGSVVRRAAVPARSRLVSMAALYAINPCTEEVARKALESATPRPVALVSMGLPPKLAAPAAFDEDPAEDKYDDDL